ncbi:hypothetical protein E4665_06380 [Sporolactobacillus shoreae]|uniref:Uncharacterized protein n=1 Tax=Sporolactobacillus shoreae TaxID=1465501 RepID=A0A4Z0GPM1_9BACL|nr:hypothetical protein [Sporolactobacillus shoreae]TGA98948.1 hypothetical protein E4665_06380 [Sporolactobacillus shoreae]
MNRKKLVSIGWMILFLTVLKFPIMGLDTHTNSSILGFIGPLIIALIIYLLPLYFVAKDKKWAIVVFSVILLLTLLMGGSSGVEFAATTHSALLKGLMITLLIVQLVATIYWFFAAFVQRKK